MSLAAPFIILLRPMQVGFLYGILGVLCILPIPAVIARMREHRAAVSQAVAAITSRALDDDSEWVTGPGGLGNALGLAPLGDTAESLVAGTISRVAGGIVALHHTANAAGSAGDRLKTHATGAWQMLRGDNTDATPLLREPSDGDLRAALLAPPPPSEAAAGPTLRRAAAAPARLPMRAAAQAAADADAAPQVLDEREKRRLDGLESLLRSATFGAWTLPPVMVVCGACFILRAVMFLWRPFKALSITDDPCCGSIFADKLCPAAQFSGVWAVGRSVVGRLAYHCLPLPPQASMTSTSTRGPSTTCPTLSRACSSPPPARPGATSSAC